MFLLNKLVNYVMTPEVLFEDAMEFSAGLGEIYSCLHNLAKLHRLV